MSSFLEKISLLTKARLEKRKLQFPLDLSLGHQASEQDHAFIRMLSEKKGPKIIAEIKKQSPSKGVINTSISPRSLADAYEASGAGAISVLTEPEYFGGDVQDLISVRGAVPQMPLLQKDFVIDPYQIFEAHALGANCVLLIMALLGEAKTREYQEIAHSLGLDALVEVHTAQELDMALRAGAKIVGINNRDLHTLKISLDVSRELISKIPEEVYAICESGIQNGAELRELSELGFDGFLIGTAFMQHESPGEALKLLIEVATNEG